VPEPVPALPRVGTPVGPTGAYREARQRLMPVAVWADRELAMRVECRWCGAGVGEPCQVNGRPLLRSASHGSRLEAAQHLLV
jgi:hypothetical protein